MNLCSIARVEYIFFVILGADRTVAATKILICVCDLYRKLHKGADNMLDENVVTAGSFDYGEVNENFGVDCENYSERRRREL